MLLASSAVITLARRAAAGGNARRSHALLGMRGVLAAVFLAVKGIEYAAKLHAGRFGVPVMRVKQDAIPGMMIPVSFTATVVGDYEIVCSQLCGLGHYRMRGVLRVVGEPAYRARLAEQRELS